MAMKLGEFVVYTFINVMHLAFVNRMWRFEGICANVIGMQNLDVNGSLFCFLKPYCAQLFDDMLFNKVICSD